VLTFGFSPFFNLQRSPFHGSLFAHLGLTFLFHHGNNLYQFQNLAFSKARCVDVSWNARACQGGPGCVKDLHMVCVVQSCRGGMQRIVMAGDEGCIIALLANHCGSQVVGSL
jgi:hypothetical protein